MSKRRDQVFPLEANKLYQAVGITKKELFTALIYAASDDYNIETAIAQAEELLEALRESEKVRAESEFCQSTGYEYPVNI